MDREALDRTTSPLFKLPRGSPKAGTGAARTDYGACLIYELRERGLKRVVELLIHVR
jgi:hypothetical protein